MSVRSANARRARLSQAHLPPFVVLARPDAELVEPGHDGGPADLRDTQGADGLLKRHGAAGKDAVAGRRDGCG